MTDNELYGPDDRVTCSECARMQSHGMCTATRRKEITGLRRRCWDYIPLRDNPDQRKGSERFATNDPELLAHYGAAKALIAKVKRGLA